MPKNNNINKILIIGAGPIVIGQACEFDYSGTQAARALKEEGYKIVLINSNPATIMTDPQIADATYIEPLTVEFLEAIIIKEKPDAILPTVGGQTALNLAIELHKKGFLEKYNAKLFESVITLTEFGSFKVFSSLISSIKEHKSTSLSLSFRNIFISLFRLFSSTKGSSPCTLTMTSTSKSLANSAIRSEPEKCSFLLNKISL